MNTQDLPERGPQPADFGHDLKHRAQDFVHETENYVRGNPVPAILGAVAIGVVIGLVARSLERHREPEPIHDALDELRALLKPLAKKTRKAYANSSHAVHDAVNQAVDRARDLDVEHYVDPVAKWWKRLWT